MNLILRDAMHHIGLQTELQNELRGAAIRKRKCSELLKAS